MSRLLKKFSHNLQMSEREILEDIRHYKMP